VRDAQDFDAFYDATSRRLHHQMYAMTGNLADAQECVQEAYARAWHRWAQVSRADDPLLTFLDGAAERLPRRVRSEGGGSVGFEARALRATRTSTNGPAGRASKPTGPSRWLRCERSEPRNLRPLVELGRE
jgi:hypothetical protein